MGEVMSARRGGGGFDETYERRSVMGLKEISLLVSAFFLEGVCLLGR